MKTEQEFYAEKFVYWHAKKAEAHDEMKRFSDAWQLNKPDAKAKRAYEKWRVLRPHL